LVHSSPPGPDGIQPILLQRALSQLATPIRKILISSLALVHIPTAWGIAKVVFIPKAGKMDITDPNSLRPISLTSFLLKKKLVDVSIRSTLLVEHPLQRTQHAYRAGRSTDTALYHMKSLIEDSLTHKEVALCAFLDIQGAFDNTSNEAVNASLARGLDATTKHMDQVTTGI